MSILVFIVSLVASGCSYSQIGSWSLLVGGIGLSLSLVFLSLGICCCHLPQDDSTWDISGNQWLKNYHIHNYMSFLACQFPTIGFRYSYDLHTIDTLMKEFTTTLPSEIKNFERLNLPIVLWVSKNHWTLVYIDRTRRTVEYYDSLKEYGDYTQIVRNLTTLADILSQQEPDQPPYQLICKINKVLQRDSYQCGVWVLFFLEQRLKNPDFDFNQLDIQETQKTVKRCRKKIMTTLIEMDRLVDLAPHQYFDEIDHLDAWRNLLNGQGQME